MKKLIIALVLVGIFGVGGYTLFKFEQPQRAVGAVSSVESTSDFNAYNGIYTYYRRQVMTKATTTPCALKSPNATTTFVGGSASVSSGTTTAAVVGLYKATTAFATTTIIAQLSPGANTLYTLVATSTTGAYTDNVVAPNSYIVFGESGGTGTFSNIGTCEVTLRGI